MGRWSPVGLVLSVPWALLSVLGYYQQARCMFPTALGGCPDPKSSGWLMFIVGLPWSGFAGAGGIADVVLLISPLLNVVLLYHVGRAVQFAWSGPQSVPARHIRLSPGAGERPGGGTAR